MIGRMGVVLGALTFALAGSAFAQTGAAPVSKPAPKPVAKPPAAPTIVVETSKGTFEFETFTDTAPKSVAHIVGLVKRRFYDGQRFHRVIPGFVAQFGDPLSRDLSKSEDWGYSGSGPQGALAGIGVAEISKTHVHDKKGMVALAHAGDPAKTADSQLYVTLAPQPQLNSGYAVIGQVTSGMDVVEKIQQNDIIKKVIVK